MKQGHISKITFPELEKNLLDPKWQHECQTALYDLSRENNFRPKDPCFDEAGPFELRLSRENQDLVFRLYEENSQQLLWDCALHITGLRLQIRAYISLCATYYDAMRGEFLEKLEEIDRHRRTLHDEAAEKLLEILTKRVQTDKITARRLWTLICAMQMRPEDVEHREAR